VDELLSVVSTIVIVSFLILVSIALLQGSVLQGRDVGNQLSFVVERGQKNVEISENDNAQLCIEYLGNNGKHDYQVKIVSLNVKSLESVALYPAVLFKGQRASIVDENGDIDEGIVTNFQKNVPQNIGGLTFDISTSEPPMKKVSEESYIYPEGSSAAEVKKKIFMGNFLVQYVNYIDPKLDVPLLPDPNLGPCTQEISVECKSGKKQLYLSIPKDRHQCDNLESCSQSINLCNGEITIELTDYGEPDEECPNKEPHFKFIVYKQAEEWEKGEDVILSFWEYHPDNKNMQSCWKQTLTTLTPTCFGAFFGSYQFSVSPDISCV
jgi:hypothetical protein